MGIDDRQNRLPEGVSPDNNAESGIEGSARFQATPDVSTPQIGAQRYTPEAAAKAAAPRSSGKNDLMSRERQNIVILIAVVALAMALAAVFRVYNPRDPMPLCSEQPEWNQYNCRAD